MLLSGCRAFESLRKYKLHNWDRTGKRAAEKARKLCDIQPGRERSLYGLCASRFLRLLGSAKTSSSSLTTWLKERSIARFLAITRTSIPRARSRRPRRKNSRTSRLIRFRTTALPTLPLTVIPNRVSPTSLVLVITTKLAEWVFLPLRESLENSRRFLRRAVFGKPS